MPLLSEVAQVCFFLYAVLAITPCAQEGEGVDDRENVVVMDVDAADANDVEMPIAIEVEDDAHHPQGNDDNDRNETNAVLPVTPPVFPEQVCTPLSGQLIGNWAVNPDHHDSEEQKRLQKAYIQEWRDVPNLGFVPSENLQNRDLPFFFVSKASFYHQSPKVVSCTLKYMPPALVVDWPTR